MRKVCLLRDLADFIDACDIRATANASRELPDMLAKSRSAQSRRSVRQHEQLTRVAAPIHHVRGPAIGGAADGRLLAVVQDASFFIRSARAADAGACRGGLRRAEASGGRSKLKGRLSHINDLLTIAA